MRDRNDAILLALQIAYEYDNWGEEHVSMMLDTYEDQDEPAPATYDELMLLVVLAAKHKLDGKSFTEAEKLMNQERG